MDALSYRGTNPNLDLARLAKHALTAATKSTMAANGGDLTPAVAAMEHRGRALLAIRSAFRHEIAFAAPPAELVDALRCPKGAPRRVNLARFGLRAVVVHPIGKPSPDRELAVWRSLIRYIRGLAA